MPPRVRGLLSAVIGVCEGDQPQASAVTCAQLASLRDPTVRVWLCELSSCTVEKACIDDHPSRSLRSCVRTELSDDGGDGDIPVSLGGDGIISGPAFNANGDPIPTPQTLGGLSAHQYPPAVSARNAGHAKPRNAIPPPLKRGGSAKGLLKAQTELASGGAVKLCTESGSLRRQLPARALLADPAAGVGALEDTPGAGLMTVLTETEGNEPGADEADETAGEADAAADAEAAADSGAVEADGGAAAIDAAEQTPVALPVVEEQPISVQEQGSPDNQPEGVAAGALPDVDGNPADELGPAAAAAALNGPLPEAQAQRQAAGAGTAAAASGAGPNDEAVGRPGADAAAVDAGASAEAAAAADVTAEPDAGSEIQSAMGAAAAGNTVAAVGGAADAVRAASQEKVRDADVVYCLAVYGIWIAVYALSCAFDTNVPVASTLHAGRPCVIPV